MTKKTKDARYSRYIFINNTIWYAVGIFDYLNTSAIYTSYVTTAFMAVFRQTLQFIFLPIYAINTAVYAVLGLANLLYDRDKETKKIKKENVVRLIVNIFSAVIVGIAVIGSLAFAASMGIATTILFSLNLAITGIYNFAGGTYHLYQFIKKGKLLKNDNLDPKVREQLITERKAHLGSTIGYYAVGTTITLSILAGSLAILGGFLPLAALGIAGGIMGAAFCIYAIVSSIIQKKNENSACQKNPSAPKESSKPNSTIKVIKELCHGLTSRIANFGKSFYPNHSDTSVSRSAKNKPDSKKENRPLLVPVSTQPRKQSYRR